jgi:two-component system sensor histidine kinase KdpD
MTRRDALIWLLWAALTLAATLVMLGARGDFDQVHVVLVYLLIVLGASASVGRLLGVLLACTDFLLIDYYFQPPFDHFAVGKAPDWVALIAFLVTAVVSTQLLSLARAEAAAARRRTDEVSSLARLGSETLSVGRAEAAPARIAEIIQGTLGMSECSIVAWDRERGLRAVTPSSVLEDEPLLRLTAERGSPAWVRASGEVVQTTSGADLPPPTGERVRVILIPLSVQGRVVGVLRLGNATALTLEVPQRRFLDAITYYAALAVDRVRLVAEAEHAEALREANRLKDIVLASVSHDLRTPLTTIKALAQSEAMQGNRSAAAIEEQADRLTRLVSDLLDLSRLKGGGFAVALEINTAEDLIGAAVRQTRGLFQDQPVRTVIDLSSPALVGRFDFAQSLRVLSNLLENAARYSPPTQPIELGAHRDGDMLAFTVADRGPGVPLGDAPRIFEPFYRAPGATPDAGRAGLGLSIARTLAEMQGGSVTYTPRDGGGSVFALRLPATEVGPEALESAAEGAPR